MWGLGARSVFIFPQRRKERKGFLAGGRDLSNYFSQRRRERRAVYEFRKGYIQASQKICRMMLQRRSTKKGRG